MIHRVRRNRFVATAVAELGHPAPEDHFYAQVGLSILLFRPFSLFSDVMHT